MSRLLSSLSDFFRKGEKRISSEQFEHAVNLVLLSDTVADAVKKNIITPEGSKPRPPLTVKSETAIAITAINSQANLIKNYEKVTKF